MSADPLKVTSSEDDTASSLELWLRPANENGSSALLTVSTPESPQHLTLRQYTDGLLVQRTVPKVARHRRPLEIEVEHLLHAGQQAFVTITSGSESTAIYLNGAVVRISRDRAFSASDFAGQIVLGSSPVDYDTWSGELRGLAVYKQELNASEVSRHYETWTGRGQPEVSQSEGILALYVFDERTGVIIHNRVSSEPDLHIPDRYQIPHKIFLEPPWKEFRANWPFLENILINLTGFIPFGFLFCIYFSAPERTQTAITTIVVGATLSLIIEIAQISLPTRSSSMTDLLTNTMGTGIGAILCCGSKLQARAD